MEVGRWKLGVGVALAISYLLSPISLFAQGTPIATTSFTRTMLRGADSAAVRASLGFLSTNNTVITNYTGNGASITNLNADELRSGTVPLARLSGITASQIANDTLTTNKMDATAYAAFTASATDVTATGLAAGAYTVAGNGIGLTNIPSQYNYLGIFAHSLSSGLPAIFGFKASIDATNWVTLGMANFEDGRGDSRLYAPAIARVGTNWVVTYDPFAVLNYGAQVSNVWGRTWSPDLITWASPTFITNTFTSDGYPWASNSVPFSTNHIVGGPDYYTDANGTVYHYLPLYVATGAPLYVQTNTDSSGLNWSSPRVCATNVTDVSIIEEGGIVYAFLSNTGLGFDLATNGVSPGSWFTRAKLDLFPGMPVESPQIIKVGTSNYILTMEFNPNGVCKTYYSRSSDLYNWSTPVPINEDGVNGSRTKLHHIANGSQAVTLRSFIQNQESVFQRSYEFFSTNETARTNISLPIGGGTVAKISYSIVAASFDQVLDGFIRAGEWEFSGVFYQDGQSIPSAVKQVGDLVWKSRRRPSTDYDVTVTFNTALGDGYRSGPYLKFTAPAEQIIRWRVTEKIETAAASAMTPEGTPQGFDTTMLTDAIFTPTNSTAPANTSTIRAWVNVTLPDGNTFKMPLYK